MTENTTVDESPSRRLKVAAVAAAGLLALGAGLVLTSDARAGDSSNRSRGTHSGDRNCPERDGGNNNGESSETSV